MVLRSYLATESVKYSTENPGQTRNQIVTEGAETVAKAAEEVRGGGISGRRGHRLKVSPSSLLNKTIAD